MQRWGEEDVWSEERFDACAIGDPPHVCEAEFRLLTQTRNTATSWLTMNWEGVRMCTYCFYSAECVSTK